MIHVTDKTAAWLAGELEPADLAAFEQHLAECTACAGEAEAARLAWEMLEPAAEPAPSRASVWPAVQARTTRKTGNEGDWFFGAGPWTRRGLATGAMAAGLALGTLLPGQWTGNTAEAEPVDPRLAGSTWLADGSADDLATWWLTADYDEEEGS